jgi:putative resolvase
VPVVRVEGEVTSGVTGRRAGLRRLLADPAVGTGGGGGDPSGLAGAAERRTGGGGACGARRLVVLDDGEVTKDLIGDMVQVLTNCCARLYERESARNRALNALRCAERDIGPAAVAAGGNGDRVLG